MSEERLLQGIVLHPVHEKWNWFIRLEPVFSGDAHQFGVQRFLFPEPLAAAEMMYGWTEHALQVMNELGIVFPFTLYGPVAFPSVDMSSCKGVRLWLSSENAAGEGNSILAAVEKIVDSWMAGEYKEELSADDVIFLDAYYPSYPASVAKERLRSSC